MVTDHSIFSWAPPSAWGERGAWLASSRLCVLFRSEELWLASVDLLAGYQKKRFRKPRQSGTCVSRLRAMIWPSVPWNLSLSQSSDTPLQYARLAAWLRLMADALDKGMVPSTLPSASTSPLGLQYDKFHLEGDPLRAAPKPMTKEQLADVLEEAAREVLLPDRTTDLVALNLVHHWATTCWTARCVQIKLLRGLDVGRAEHHKTVTSAAWMKAPGVVGAAAALPWNPGKVSLGPEIGETMKEMCRRVKQGERCRSAARRKGKGQEGHAGYGPASPGRAVVSLHGFLRHNAATSRGTAWEARIEKLHPLVRRSSELRPFGDDSVKE